MIHHASVLSPLMRYAARGADVMIVDPPYAAKVHRKAISAGTGGAGVRKRYLGFAHLSEALRLRLALYASEVRRWSVVFCDLESVHLWIAAMSLYGVEYVRTVPWVRWSQPQMSGDRPPTGAEAVCVFHAPRANQGGGKMHWNGPGGRIKYGTTATFSEDVMGVPTNTPSPEPVARILYDAKSLRGADKYSCEKPLDLILALVSDYSDPGETVFDPCAGSGTTLLAAQLLGREAWGVDCSAEAVERAECRLCASDEEGRMLSERDEDRAVRWYLETQAEAQATPAPKAANGSDVKTYERAQRRIADCQRLLRAA